MYSIQKVVFWICTIYILVGLVFCVKKQLQDDRGNTEMPSRPVEEVLEEHTTKWMSIPGVVGTGQGLCDEKPCIKIYVMEINPELKEKIPPTIEGYKIELVETGAIRALDKEKKNSG